MMFKKGSKVEVFRKDDAPFGSWRCGELVSGNGRYYDVRFDDRSLGGAAGAPVGERISRKVIRPCPPPVYSVRDWVPGDLVEVFDNINMSWKSAIVSKVTAEEKYCFVKLIGSSEDLRVHKSQVRVRQAWQGNEWVRVGACEGGKSDLIKGASTGGKRKLREEDYYFPAVNNNKDFEKKMRAVENDDAESSASSVGSCSINSRSPCRFPHCLSTLDSGDAESICGLEHEEKRFPRRSTEDAKVDNHKLELHAYRCTIGALYCSEGLSWKQEDLVTNLRLTLHITNDEHSTLLRDLVSGETNPNTRFQECIKIIGVV